MYQMVSVRVNSSKLNRKVGTILISAIIEPNIVLIEVRMLRGMYHIGMKVATKLTRRER